ncbi:MAG: DnaJ domain-containing protein, partial [Synergistaceae bacterium]|nr:DnaJ domain-containing protein [Synergistaceae bacterium]
MSVSFEVTHSLRVLGLPPDATASEVRSAFRRLARTCHPDIAGKQGARKFEQITGAYTFLKNLTQEELQQGELQKDGHDGARRDKSVPKVFRWKKERLNAEKIRKERVARETEEKVKRTREASIETILARGEQAVDNLLNLIEQESQNGTIQDLFLRLSSRIPQV